MFTRPERKADKNHVDNNVLQYNFVPVMINETTKIQNDINKLCKCNYLSGDVYLVVNIRASNYNELNNISTNIINNLLPPSGFTRTENIIHNKKLSIYISFNKI